VTILVFALVGSVAQFIDGSIGMGFGLTSSTLLLSLGVGAAAASAAVHFAEIPITLASGFSHWHRDNIDFKILRNLALPGGVGALLGATFLSSIDFSNAKVFVSTLLFLLGFLLIYRNLWPSITDQNIVEVKSPFFIPTLGFAAGFVDASGGGGWGPVVTPTLMATSSIETRKIIGTVSASEFVVSTAASIGFLLNISRFDVEWQVVAGMALGGTLVAPFAAKLVRILPKRQLSLIVGIGIIVINAIRIVTA